MPASQSPIPLLADPARRSAALEQILPTLGWPTPERLVGTQMIEVLAGGEPQVLFAERNGPARAVSLAYTREAPFLVAFTSENVSLHASRRWSRVAGDCPLVEVSFDDQAAVADLLDLVRRDQVVSEALLDIPGGGTDHRPLHDVLGSALRTLRQQVAEADAYQAGISRDTAVLRLFHQLLYIRVIEDRGVAPVEVSIREIMVADDPSSALEDCLLEYEAKLDSELFAWTGVKVAGLPRVALRDVLAATVEPWEALRLDFSVSRTELASRLYESYLRDLPVRRAADRSGRLFDVADSVDARERQATFYTPPALAALVASNALSRRLQPGLKPDQRIRIVDPACGSGAFLVAAYRLLRRAAEDGRGRSLTPAEREHLLTESIFGADLDERALGIARVQLLEEAELRQGLLPSLENNLFVGDALRSPPGAREVENAVPWSRILSEHGSFDCVLTNPPFGAQAKLPKRLTAATVMELTGLYPEVGAFGQDLAYLFVALSRRLADSNSVAGFILPRTVLNQPAGRGARQLLAAWGPTAVNDLRAAAVFPGISASVCTIAVDSAADETMVTGIIDSRLAPKDVLDAMQLPKSDRVVRLRRAPAAMERAALDGFTPFRLRWEDLRHEIHDGLGRFAEDSRRVVRTGMKPARVADFVIPEQDWQRAGACLVVDGLSVRPEYLPEFVRSGDLKPFRLTRSGDRLLFPFERSGSAVDDPNVVKLVAQRGGLPRNFQRGAVDVLLGPKVLVTGFAREPAAIADISGELVPMMRGVHALRVGDVATDKLPAVAVLVQSSFYQWLVRGFGAPRRDETVETTTTAIAELPWPSLSATDLDKLMALGLAAEEALRNPAAVRRIRSFAAVRRDIDEFALDLVGASSRLRAIVRSELVRIA